jgi:hypothetical protein
LTVLWHGKLSWRSQIDSTISSTLALRRYG